MTDKIGIIGFGNIANAIITPLLDKKLVKPEDVYCVVNSEKSLGNIKKNYKHNINVYKSSSKESKIIWDCQYKLLSIKPQQFNDISEAHHKKNTPQYDLGNNTAPEPAWGNSKLSAFS